MKDIRDEETGRQGDAETRGQGVGPHPRPLPHREMGDARNPEPRTQNPESSSGLGTQDSGLNTRTRAVRQARRLVGDLAMPGDKSISHRALILNAIAEGEAVLSNLGPGADCASTMRCLRSLGVAIDWLETGDVKVTGVGLGGLREPDDLLDAGNSGTTMRLLSGLLAGQPFLSILTGDASLRSRPMRRVIDPLRKMGGRLFARRGDTLPPLVIQGSALEGIDYTLPVASAQLKTALLLAGLQAQGSTIIREPQPSRDHTERMLRAQGAELDVVGGVITLVPGKPLVPLNIQVPGDISSATFWLVAAAIHPDAEIAIKSVGMNPGRTGALEVLRSMGADLEVRYIGERNGEAVADLVARSSSLRGVTVEGDLVPRLIDEIPVLAVAALFAQGETRFADAAELRVKETDRIRALVTELSRLGGDVDELPDGLLVRGGRKLKSATCQSYGDHRMAMALSVAALAIDGGLVIQDAEAADVSYPTFWSDLESVSGGPPSC
jgi:3-phosphoshikimate 1-carboxyvinyltransferase